MCVDDYVVIYSSASFSPSVSRKYLKSIFTVVRLPNSSGQPPWIHLQGPSLQRSRPSSVRFSSASPLAYSVSIISGSGTRERPHTTADSSSASHRQVSGVSRKGGFRRSGGGARLRGTQVSLNPHELPWRLCVQIWVSTHRSGSRSVRRSHSTQPRSRPSIGIDRPRVRDRSFDPRTRLLCCREHSHLLVANGSLMAAELGHLFMDLWFLEGYRGGAAEGTWERRHRVDVRWLIRRPLLVAGGDGGDVFLAQNQGVVAYNLRSRTVRQVVGVDASRDDSLLPSRYVFRESLVRHGFFEARPHPGLPLFRFCP